MWADAIAWENLAAPRDAFDRARYLAQHAALGLLFAPAMRAFHQVVHGDLGRPDADALRELRDRLRSLLERDFENARTGIYPRDLLFELPVRQLLRELPRLAIEPLRIWRRVRRNGHDELPPDADVETYPRYYRRTFHWQTDGWLSRRSAALYDLEVEALFGGTANVMRRMALAPILESQGRRGRVVDLGCGTGELLRMLAAAAPRAELWGVDLSPFYLEQARQRLPASHRVSLVVHNAERLPFEGGQFDVACSVFVLHELPPRVRRAVVAEAARLVRPGGRVVLCDAAQYADTPSLRFFLDGFPRMYHEPYFKSYLKDDLASLADASGLEVESVSPAFLAKVVTARKR